MATDRRLRFGAKARRVEELGDATPCVPDHFDDQLAHEPMAPVVARLAGT